MKIDGSEKAKAAMKEFASGNSSEGNRLQDEFLDDLRRFTESGGDHCPCTASCSLHGDCMKCVSVHRGHKDHLPACLHEMINERLLSLSALTEHSMAKSPEMTKDNH